MEEKAVYGITAVRYAGPHVVEAMMGLMGDDETRWDVTPAPIRLNDVVDHLVEGDRVITLFRGDAGGFEAGPEVTVDVLPEGTEALSLAFDAPGRGLDDLPRF